jgi:hypothetical protein
VRDRRLLAAPYDPRWGLVAAPLAIPGTPLADGPQLATSRQGAAVWVVSPESSPSSIEWISASGTASPLSWQGPPIEPVAVEPDGQHLRVRLVRGVDSDVWVADLARGTLSRELPGAAAAVARTARAVFTRASPASGLDVWITPRRDKRCLEQQGLDCLLVRTPLDEAEPALSSDQQRLAWQSNAAGEWQVLVRDVDGRRPELTIARGTHPTWSLDGTRLWLLDDGVLMTSTLDATSWHATAAIGVARDVVRVIGVAADGRVLVERRAAVPPRGVEVILGWAQEVQAFLRQHEPMPRSFR